jgi:uncharacterized membrane protein
VPHDSRLPLSRALAPPAHARRRVLGKERLVALSEGVFAVVMTLMLLSVIDEIDSPSFDVDRLAATLVRLWPKFTAFFISFFIVGASWVSDNVVLGAVRYVDIRYLWWKLFYLLAITFLGFSTTLIGEHPDHWLVETIYGGNMLLVYLTSWFAWRYALDAGLVGHDTSDQALLRTVWQRIRIGLVAHGIGPLFSLINPMVSFAYFMILGCGMIFMQIYSTFEWAPVLDATVHPQPGHGADPARQPASGHGEARHTVVE